MSRSSLNRKSIFVVGLLSFLCVQRGTLDTARAGVTFGSLSWNYGDAYVSDSLNNLQWMHFDAPGNNQSVAGMLASFADPNSDLFGFQLAGPTHADLFLDAAFGAANYQTNSPSRIVMKSGVAAAAFVAVMGDGFSGNNNSIWKYFVSDNTTGGAIHFDWVSQSSSSTDLNHWGNIAGDPNTWQGDMAWLAFRSSSSSSNSTVPEPNSLMIFGSLFLACCTRFRRS